MSDETEDFGGGLAKVIVACGIAIFLCMSGCGVGVYLAALGDAATANTEAVASVLKEGR